jgi:hypothetical protein
MPVGVARYGYYTPRAWAVVGGVRAAIVGFQVDYELSAIPRAQVRFPLGRSTADGTPAALHQIAQDLATLTPIEIWCSFSPAGASDPGVGGLGLPDGAFLVFTGFTAGLGYVFNAAGTAQAMLSCVGWLDALNRGSIFSQSSHPANPSQYAYASVTGGGEDTGGQHWTPLTTPGESVTPQNLAADVWGKALYPWFTSLAGRDGIWVVEKNLRGDPSNKQALAALRLMAPGGPYYVPASLNAPGAVDVDTAAEISADVAALTFQPEALAHQTLWDTLVAKFGPDYGLAVVPRVSDALVVPFCPCVRAGGQPFAAILAQDYVGTQLEGSSRRPLRAWGVLSALSTRSGFEATAENPAAAVMGVGGWFDSGGPGAVILQAGPTWMNRIVAPARFSDAATGADRKAIGSALSPRARASNGSCRAAKTRGEKVVKPLLDAYAQSRYAQAVLQGRYGVVSGAFRVDIAPGSTVLVEGASDAAIAGSTGDGLGQPFYGQVLRVSLALDAEAPLAGAAFHVGYARTAAEDASDTASVAAHPLYKRTFLGSPLVLPG